MNHYILAQAVQDYIDQHIHKDVHTIALSKSPFIGITSAELANQINAKKKAEKKLPSWFNSQNIYYPSALSIEQTSSEITAKYKASLAIGKTLIDLTGGFGVDTFYFSKQVAEVTHCEIDVVLSQISKHNAGVLNAKNIEFKPVNGIELITKSTQYYNNIYLDPARRADKGKVFMLKDCTPNIIENMDVLLSRCDQLILKSAPLLDITAGLNELCNVKEIHIISVKNECKELLWILEKGHQKTPKVICAALNSQTKYFSFFLNEMQTLPSYAKQVEAGDYLYEPDVALLKSGAFNLIAKNYNLLKLHPQTQLYTSNVINKNFPGRIFKINQILFAADLKKTDTLKGNVIVRNYPAKPEELIKKYKIKSDLDQFLIFSKNADQHHIIIRGEIIQYY